MWKLCNGMDGYIYSYIAHTQVFSATGFSFKPYLSEAELESMLWEFENPWK